MNSGAICLLGLTALGLASSLAHADAPVAKKSHFTLWQLREQTHSQMMCYAMKTSGGKLIVIDGGMKGDAPALRRFIKSQGNHVDAWFISHAHNDHYDALGEILKQPDGITISQIYGSLPTEEWTAQYEKYCADDYVEFNAALRGAKRQITELELGQTMDIDGVHVEVLGIRNPEIHPNALNNSSAVLRFSDATKSVIFLGDLGPEGGEKLLKGPYGDRLRSDYVQMAHHGQNGVGEAVYQAIQPKYCLWTTPLWLWDNNSGKGKGSGPWKTLEVRAWMDKLNIKRHYVSAYGVYEIQ